MIRNDLVLVRGGGRLGTAVAHRLRLCGFPVIVTEAARPTAIHLRAVFAAAIYEGEAEIEGVSARRTSGPEGIREILQSGALPVLIDPAATIRDALAPWVVVDAIGLERNVGTRRGDAPIVIALGPGFRAGPDAHAVVDPRPGPDLGRFTTEGPLREPGVASGLRVDRAGLVMSPAVGRFEARSAIGRLVRGGEVLGLVGRVEATAPRDGLLTGLLSDGAFVGLGVRLADVDLRTDSEALSAIDPVARAAAGGVLEAILYTAAVGAEPGQPLQVRRDSID